MVKDKTSKANIRNRTVDFLVFTKDAGADSIEVRVQDHDVWLTQKAMGELFEVDRSVIGKHLKKIFADEELNENSTCAKFAQVADNGKTYQYKFYALSAIIAVGYKVNSQRAIQFRQWATKVLDTFAKQGYVLDKNRLITRSIARPHGSYLPRCRTKCTMLSMAVPPQNLSILLQCIWIMLPVKLAVIFP